MDNAGNQLPYLDTIPFTVAEDPEPARRLHKRRAHHAEFVMHGCDIGIEFGRPVAPLDSQRGLAVAQKMNATQRIFARATSTRVGRSARIFRLEIEWFDPTRRGSTVTLPASVSRPASTSPFAAPRAINQGTAIWLKPYTGL